MSFIVASVKGFFLWVCAGPDSGWASQFLIPYIVVVVSIDWRLQVGHSVVMTSPTFFGQLNTISTPSGKRTSRREKQLNST